MTPNIALFDPPVKIRGGVGELSGQIVGASPTNEPPIHIWWPYSARLQNAVSRQKRKKESTAVKLKAFRLTSGCLIKHIKLQPHRWHSFYTVGTKTCPMSICILTVTRAILGNFWTWQNDLCCFIGLTFTLYLKLTFLQQEIRSMERVSAQCCTLYSIHSYRNIWV